MVKSAKGKPAKDAQPEIWAEGKQHVPLETDPLARVTIILARRAASSVWNQGSILVANAAFAVEDGFGKGFIGRLGRLAWILPQRDTVCLALAHFSHLESKAAFFINHVGEAVAPLEAGDLAGFMTTKRQEARLAAAERDRKAQIARMAQDRAARISRKATTPLPPVSPWQATGAEPEEMAAIRAALAAYSGPEPVPAPVEPPPPPLRTPPSRSLFDQTRADSKRKSGLPPDDVVMAAARPASLFAPMKKLAVLPALALRGLSIVFARLWVLIGPAVTRASAWTLAWGMFALMVPVGLYRAIRAHLSGQDLRYFD